ncbi:MAG: PAS domain S-box protein [Thermoflexales bacterium]|nr:PAS domain S-box protein [Thermoflexales bacterium]
MAEHTRARKSTNWEVDVNAAATELSRALLSQSSIEDISYLVLEHARQLTGSRFGYVGYIDPQTGHLVSPTLTRDIWDGCQVADKNFIFSKFGGLWGWVLEHRQSLMTNSPCSDPRSGGVPEGHIPVHRFLSVPALMGNETLVGQIALANAEGDYTEQDLAAVERLASLYALAVQRKWSEQRLHLQITALEAAANAIVITNRQGNIVWVNPAFTRLTGYTAQEVIGQNPRALKSGQHDEAFYCTMWETILSGQVWRGDMVNRRKDGSLYFEEMTITPVRDEDGGISHFIAIKQDVTDRKQAEEALKHSLQEKEMLLKEIHHRVKNNLQIISSLLSLQTEYIQDEKTLDLFKESQNRIRSMALLHEKLYQSKDLALIDFRDYLSSLIAHIFRSYATKATIRVGMDIDEIYLNIDTAIPCGLIVNELVANALKYAFPRGQKGEVDVQFHRDGDDYALAISDNGVGLPEALDVRNTQSLGLQLVHLLTEELDGTLEVKREPGTTFTLSFPVAITEK